MAARDPGQVVMAKPTLGNLATAALALVAAEPWRIAGAALGLLAVGATGYGLSLRLFLLAQHVRARYLRSLRSSVLSWLLRWAARSC